MKNRLVGRALLALCVFGCSEVPPDYEAQDANVSGVALQLTTQTASGNQYRLGPASFTIRSDWDTENVTEVQVSGAEPSLNVPVTAG